MADLLSPNPLDPTESVVTNPIDNPELYHSVRIGGQLSPGYCKVSGFKRAHEWDVKKGKGAKGANITFVQRPPAKGSITFYLGWFDANGIGGGDHFAEWDLFLPLLKYDPTKKAPQAVDIFHPALARVDITSVVTENVGVEEDVGDGLYAIQVDFLEYFPPPAKNATGSPTGSDANRIHVSPGGDAIADPESVVKKAGDGAEDLLKQLQQQPSHGHDAGGP